MKTGALEQKTYRELRRLAARAGLAGRGRMRRSQLVRALLRGRKRRKTVRGTALAKDGKPRARAQRLLARKLRKQAAALPAAAAERLPRRRSSELPAAYGRTRLTLMEIDPRRVHAYWEVTPEDRAAAMARIGGPDAAVGWTLRFYQASGEHDESEPRFDIPVDLAPGNWYVTLPSEGMYYCADLGPVAAGGGFTAACRSNVVRVPRAGASPHYAPQWLEVGLEGAGNAPVPETAARPSGAPSTEGEPSAPPQPGQATGALVPDRDAATGRFPGADEIAAPVTASHDTEADASFAFAPGLEDISSYELGSRGPESAKGEAAVKGGPQRSK